MKKKKETSSATSSPLDLKAIIHDHSLFFDALIELIPARFYLPTDEDDNKPWFQGLSISKKAAAKKQTRENLKKARRNRLDPETNSQTTSTLQLLKKSIIDENQQMGNDEGFVINNERSVTFEELRKRLHRKIELQRGNRGESSRRSEKREINRKRKQEWISSKAGGDKKNEIFDEINKDVTEAVKGVEFGKVKLGGDGEEEEKIKKKRKLSKEKELEKARKLQEAKRDPEKGDEVAKKHSWKAAVSRAAGVKIHDDPKLIKQSMNKEKKRHEKNAEKWKDRVETREKMKKEKQQKRAGNIADRIQQKKIRKIAKREKKLMRPGFEGRKEGFINKS